MQKKSKIIVGASIFIIFCISLMTFLWINSQSFKQETANLISKQVEKYLRYKNKYKFVIYCVYKFSSYG